MDGVGQLNAGSFSGAPSRTTSCSVNCQNAVSTGSVSRSTSGTIASSCYSISHGQSSHSIPSIPGGSFIVRNFDASVAAQDNFEPDRIRDLTLAAAVYGASDITVKWTAPGDDLDQGTGILCVTSLIVTDQPYL